MPGNCRWDPCILNRGTDAVHFVNDHFCDGSRRVLLIAGAGFDPRAIEVAQILATRVKGSLTGLFIRERRPDPNPDLLRRAERNITDLLTIIPNGTVRDVDIFAPDLAVKGGREAALTVAALELDSYTDVLVDNSALSRGVVFPMVKVLLNRAPKSCNIHIAVVDEPETDQSIVTIGCDRPSPIHGFRGILGTSEASKAAVLWLPQLVPDQSTVLRDIYNFIDPRPSDVCPILPFPGPSPRDVDELLVAYRTELLSTWQVDPRDLVYAHENDPLDLYRTILRIDNDRKRVFKDVGGSLIVLSPVGSKVLSIGAMMAAIERDFPVIYVEALGYEVDQQRFADRAPGEIVHIWLHGEAYA